MNLFHAQPFKLEKTIWTDADLDRMGWHDARIYQISFSGDLSFDIDYIFQWNQPLAAGMPFTFWVAPVTLVFTNARLRGLDLLTTFYDDAFEIDYIEKNESETVKTWRIITQRGEMEFEADGFIQYVRQQPTFQYGQTIPYMERGGVSVEQTTKQENRYVQSEEYIRLRQCKEESYSYAIKHREAKNELKELQRKRDAGEVATKDYLVEKKRLNDLMFSHSYWIKDEAFKYAAGLT
jgi:hypothetical protein